MSDDPQANPVQDSTSGRRRPLLFLLALIAISILGFVFIRNLIDFPVYYAAGRSLIGGRSDLYSPDFASGRVMDYRYPPFFLFALTPLWLMPYAVAAYVWYLLEIIQILGCVAIVRREASAHRLDWKVWLITTLCVGQYYVMIVHYGNAHLMAVFLSYAAFYFAFAKKNLPAALAMSLAITIKLTPILFLPYFALKGKRRFLLRVAALLIAINLTPAAYFGFRQNAQLLKTWYSHVVADQEFHETNGPINLSLKGQLRRYLTSVDYSQRVDGDVEYPAVNLASLSTQQTDAAWIIISALVFASALGVIWKTSTRGPNKAGVRTGMTTVTEREPSDGWPVPRAALEFGLMICVGLLVEPLTSKIYFIALLWPVVVLSSFSLGSGTPAARFAYRAILVISAINSVLPLLPGRQLQRLLLVLGVDFYVNCLLLAALGYALIATRRRVERPSPERRTQVPSAAKTP
ncbi:MAG TPA: glycosyltransferase family 87 protein [Blastocatellia bacterium]|nr:glycosyltransferase family 87 protein [Blastocatellia bacterium]